MDSNRKRELADRLEDAYTRLQFVSNVVGLMPERPDFTLPFSDAGLYGFVLVVEDIARELEQIREQL